MNQSSLQSAKDFVPIKIHYQSPGAVRLLSRAIREFAAKRPNGATVVILCIGTDRSTGDSLGPLIGTHLADKFRMPNVYGTLDNPVHAVNLEDSLAHISEVISQPFFLAIDACLGHHNSIGEITIAQGSLKPGAGVNKSLPEVGDYHITGVVNIGGFMEYFVLQNTRLSLVYQMADVIAQSIALGLRQANAYDFGFLASHARTLDV